jgi:HPt (histidine-containing phosphotransfer) domain-containing protein
MVEMLPYDLIFLDCEMPEMDGFEAAREIRRREAGGGRHLPVVAMTARALQGDRERCLAAGMDDYLSKPVGLDALAAMLQRYAGQREAAGTAAPGASAAAADPAAGGPERRVEVVLDPRRVEELSRIAANRQNLAYLADCFLASAEALLERLRAAAAAGDAMELKSASHSLKGACANLGARSMVPVCAALDELGRSGALAGATGLLERLVREFTQVRGALAVLRRGGEADASPTAGGTDPGGGA